MIFGMVNVLDELEKMNDSDHYCGPLKGATNGPKVDWADWNPNWTGFSPVCENGGNKFHIITFTYIHTHIHVRTHPHHIFNECEAPK